MDVALTVLLNKAGHVSGNKISLFVYLNNLTKVRLYLKLLKFHQYPYLAFQHYFLF